MIVSIISELHVLIGTLGLLCGLAAIIASKGKKLHRAAGNIFFGTMLITALFGLHTSYYKTDIPHSTVLFTVFIGLFTIYLVATSWITAKRPPGKRGAPEIGALIYILATAILAITYGADVAQAEIGMRKGGAPAMPVGIFYFFAGFAAFLALGDIHLIGHGGISGSKRIARHLWRMTMAFTMTTAILFLGNPQVFPEALQQAQLLSIPLLVIPVIILLALMFCWLIKVLFSKGKSKAKEIEGRAEETQAA